jgi:hypothetical protein
MDQASERTWLQHQEEEKVMRSDAKPALEVQTIDGPPQRFTREDIFGGGAPIVSGIDSSVIQVGAIKPGKGDMEEMLKFADLTSVLNEALQQVANGKGNQRHGRGKPFTKQPILELGRMLPSADGHIFQAMKKSQEAANMAAGGRPTHAVQELLGAIVYTAAAIILIREKAAE